MYIICYEVSETYLITQRSSQTQNGNRFAVGGCAGASRNWLLRISRSNQFQLAGVSKGGESPPLAHDFA